MAIISYAKIFIYRTMLAIAIVIVLGLAMASATAKFNAPQSFSPAPTHTESWTKIDYQTYAALATAPNLAVPQRRQVQSGMVNIESVLATVRVRNIQVRAEWQILGADAKQQFTIIANGDNEYILSVRASLGVGQYTVGIEVKDKFSDLNNQYTDLSVAATIIIDVVAIPLVNAALPKAAITVVQNYAQTISTYTFRVTGGFGDKTYMLTAVNGFSVDAHSGTLSFNGTDRAGVYVLTVWANDPVSDPIALLLTAKIAATLAGRSTDNIRAPTQLTTYLAGAEFAASGGILPYTFILTDNSDHFALDANGENFRLTLAFANETTVTVGWQLDDDDIRTPSVSGQVVVNIVDGVVFLPTMEKLNITTAILAKESIFIAQAKGGQTLTNGGYIYSQIGTTPHFTLSISDAAVGAEVVMLSAITQAGALTLTIQAMDGLMPATKATMELRLSIYDELSSSLAADFSHSIFINEQGILGSVLVIGGSGDYQYTLMPSISGFAINQQGKITINIDVPAGSYTLIAKVQDVNLPSWSPVVETIIIWVSVPEGVYVLGGNGGDNARKNDVWYGHNNVWQSRIANAAWSPRGNHQVVVLNDQLYILGGQDSGGSKNDVWSSRGGKIWQIETAAAPWSARYGHQALSHRDVLFVLAGVSGKNYNHDVWQLADGKNWDLSTAQAAWSGRWYPAAVSHNNLLYILGGHDDGSSDILQSPRNMNDIWSSADGKQWTLVIAEAAWTPRRGHQAVSHQGRIFILGGENSGMYYRDIWSSRDGKIWRLEAADAPWSARAYHAAVSYRGILYIVGGENNKNKNAQDIWSSANGKQWTLVAQGEEWDKNGLAAAVFPPDLAILGISELLSMPTSYDGALYTVTAKHVDGHYTYNLVADNFTIDRNNGELRANGNATAGRQTLKIQVTDGTGKIATTEIAVLLVSPLSLSGVTVTAAADANGITELHTFAAGDGSVYSLVADNAGGHFKIDRTSGKWLALPETPRGIYSLTIVAAYYFSVPGIPSQKATVTAVVDMQIPKPPTVSMIYILGGAYGVDNNGKVLNDVVRGKDDDWRRVLSEAPWSARREFQAITHNSSLFILGGYQTKGVYANDVWATNNGTHWVLLTANANWSARYGMQAVSHNGSLFILGGYDNPATIPNDIWSSVVGQHWQKIGNMPNLADGDGRRHHRVLSHQGTLFLLGGIDGYNRNDIWSSAHGMVWNLVTINAEWSARSKHSAVLHGGKMYILGGFGETVNMSLDYKNDVWSSTDGQTWSAETVDAEWSARRDHQAVSLDGKIYIIGGIDADGNAGDVWSSADGKIWTQETGNNDLWYRNRFAAEVFP